ncbi:MAG: segregation/condensation protein A [Candidatus Woesearchaeota archaeon]|nr:segregation/condensation protein A [Candidatus Woesearchaeota archaeon]
MKETIKKASTNGRAAMTPTAAQTTQDRLLDIIVKQDDIGWRSLIFDLVDSNQMDPWDIDVSLLSQKFLDELKKLKELDFRISGKVVLASAVLLKMKADKLQKEEMAALDNLIDAVEAEDFEELDLFGEEERPELPKLIPRTPQPRKRKVTVYDLVEALEQALEVEARRPPAVVLPRKIRKINPPKNHVDISVIIKEVFDHVHNHYHIEKQDQGSLKFHHITRSKDPRDLVLAFIPLLHLENALKVEMEQDDHFGEITVHLLSTEAPDENVGKE